MREGTAVEDFLHPDRIVIGVEDDAAAANSGKSTARCSNAAFVVRSDPGKCPDTALPAWLVTTINSAELIKHASNSFLALKISYANMVADLAERLGPTSTRSFAPSVWTPESAPVSSAPVWALADLPAQRFTSLRSLAEGSGVDFSMLKEAEKINKKRIENCMVKIRRALWVVKGKPVGVLGLAFKPNTDDIRFSPSIDLVQQLVAEGARVRVFDPEAMERAKAILPDVEFAEPAYDAAQGSEALIIATEWEQFHNLDWNRIHGAMSRR